MRAKAPSFAVVTSFNEIVWLFAFALALLCADESTKLKAARQRVAATEAAMTAIVARTAAQPDQRSAQIHQELVGLRGPLRNVVLVIDVSGSMQHGRKWSDTRAVIQTWLRYLAFERCALVIFNDTVTIYPANGEFLTVAGPDGDANRHALLSQLDTLEPTGNTNTLAALRRAYAYAGVDTIVLLSDGFPDGNGRGFDRRMANAIYRLCKEHGDSVPINTVGIGGYFDKPLGEFLLRLPSLSGGTFIGR